MAANTAFVETWKPCFGDNYAISSRGRFMRVTPGRKTKPGALLALTKLKIGYYIVQPVIDGKNQQHYVHRLVAEHFIGPCPSGCEINHIDGIKTNNLAENLEYVTHEQNMKHASRYGLFRNVRKIPNDVAEKILALRVDGRSMPQIASMCSVSLATVWHHIKKAGMK